ncbi:hypothetical protein [Bradyrhizobium embrapense]|uniref:hypothetical protein n=1 Tax=Bradyrhizobium embrapense TaxID=630921 RepID=UPI0012F4D675|nr:hypothetical protein [Bradyrhizobium embrapense]
MHLSETTNGKLAEVSTQIEELIRWAEADAEHARENDARQTARDDRSRAAKLRKALALVRACER